MKARIFLLVLASLMMSGTQFGFAAISGEWTTSEGDMVVSASRNSAFKASYNQDGGRIVGQMNGAVMQGVWIEKDSERRCQSAKEGSFHWGRVRFIFNSEWNRFEGSWGYCEDQPQTAWTGNQVMALNEFVRQDLEDRLEKELEKPGAGKNAPELSKNLNRAVDDWLKDYKDKFQVDEESPAYSSQGWDMSAKDAQAALKKSAESFEKDMPQLSPELAEKYGAPYAAPKPAAQVLPDKKMIPESVDPNSSPISKELWPKPVLPPDGGLSGQGWDFDFAKNPEAVRQRFEEQIVKGLDKYFPEFKGVQGTKDASEAISKLSKVLSLSDGDWKALAEAQRAKVKTVLKAAVKETLPAAPSSDLPQNSERAESGQNAKSPEKDL